MSEYNLSEKTINTLTLLQKAEFTSISQLSDEQIESYNRGNIKNKRAFKKLYRPKNLGITQQNFIVPASGGIGLTGYLFTKNTLHRSDNGPHSLIIYFHDGGWILGNMDRCRAVCSNICRATGAAVFTVDYRLAPQFKFPIPLEDCYSAFIWAANGAKYWRIDPQKIFIMGSCCGGTLACGVSHLARDRKAPVIAGQILVSPITDCRLRTSSMEAFKDSPTLTRKDLAFCVNKYQREPKDTLNPLFSPLLTVDQSRLPQTLILVSQQDPLYDDCALYAESLNNADTPTKVIICPDQIHGFLSYPKSENWNNIMQTVTDFTLGRDVTSLKLMTKEQRKSRKPQIVVV